MSGLSPDGLLHPPAIQGQILLDVESPLPRWSIRAEVEDLRGPAGMIAPDRVLIAGPARPEFLPITRSSFIAAGKGPVPARGLPIELRIEPQWNDRPGIYRGALILVPMVGHDGSTNRNTPASPEFPPLRIPVEFEILPQTSVVTPSQNVVISAGSGPGHYALEPDLEVLAASNTADWRVLLDGSPLERDGHAIPLGRVFWAPVDAHGELGAETCLAENNALIDNHAPGQVQARFRLFIDIEPSDLAGDYVSRLRLVAAESGLGR